MVDAIRPVKVILAAVDASPRAEGVVQMAGELARRFGAVAHVFRVVAVPQAFPPAARTGPDDLPRILGELAMKDLHRLAAGQPELVEEPPELSNLEPWKLVLAKARALDADIIVVGSHAFGGWDRVLRTNADRIMERADRHVFVVHEAPPAS